MESPSPSTYPPFSAGFPPAMEGNFSYLKLMASLQPEDPFSSSSPEEYRQDCFESGVKNFPSELNLLDGEEESRSQATQSEVPDACFPDFRYEDINSSAYEGSDSENAGSDVDSDISPLDVSSDDENEVEPGNGDFLSEGFSYMLPLDESDSEEAHPADGTDVHSEVLPEQYGNIENESAVDPSPPPYKKRKRQKKGVVLPECRENKSAGPIELALRSSYGRKTEHIFHPKVGTVFDSAAEAYEFYNLYSWEKGFGISYGKCDKNRGNNYRTMQELQCSSEGSDNRTIHQSQRCGCRAIMRLLRTEDHGWYISKFVEDHNHDLSESCGEKMQWGSHRRIDHGAKTMIKHLRDNNIPLGKVHSIMGSLHGSVQDLPFTKMSLRTLCQQLAREQMDDDVKKTLQIFRKMRKEDPDFAYSVDVDKQNRIKTLIWTNHRSKMQYQCFGDVFTFDTTYCTNIYKMPFGLFVGVNNHFQSVIYAGVLMRQETIASFTWVFNEFLALMGGKAPITILTDQAQAMMPAIEKTMPRTTHLWCKWHVLRKAQESLGPVYSRNGPFRQEFHKVLNEMLTIDEFESAWAFLICKYKLKKNPFMIRIYECRSKWAKPYSKGKFCARMMSTQRGESANHVLKTYIRPNSTMNNFVSKYNDMMFDRAMEEDKEEHKTKLVEKTTGRMWPIQKHACKIYTRAAFKLFTTELEKSYHYVVVPASDPGSFQVNYSYADLREPWVRVTFNIIVTQASGKYECECGLFSHFGILCCHSIRVMNYLGVAKIPDRYILKRWTRDARDVLPESLRFLQKDNRSLKSHTFRENLLYATAMKAVKVANQDEESFDEMMKHFGKGIKAVADIAVARGVSIPEEEGPIYESSDNEWHRAHNTGYQSEPGLATDGKTIYSDVRDGAVRSNFDMAKLKAPPIPKKSRGRERFKRFLSPVEKPKGKKKAKTAKHSAPRLFKQTSFCSICKESGHKRNTCPANPDAGKNKRKTSCCSTCHLPGHKSSQCHSLTPNVDDYDFNGI